MFDVNLNSIERDIIFSLIDSGDPENYDKVIEVIETLLEIRFNRGKRLGKVVYTDAIVDSIVHELKR